MKILISTEALKRHANSIPPHAGFSQATMDWREKLGELMGKWVTVETEYLFEDQFNIVENNLRVMATEVDDIDWEEIESFDNYKRIVIERYGTDWPGSKLKFWEIQRVLFRAGKGEDPAKKSYRERGYDNHGKAYPPKTNTI